MSKFTKHQCNTWHQTGKSDCKQQDSGTQHQAGVYSGAAVNWQKDISIKGPELKIMRESPKHRQHNPKAECHCLETIKQSEKNLKIWLFAALYFLQLLNSLQVSRTGALSKGVTVIWSTCSVWDGALCLTGKFHEFFQDLQIQLPFWLTRSSYCIFYQDNFGLFFSALACQTCSQDDQWGYIASKSGSSAWLSLLFPLGFLTCGFLH